MALLNMGQVFRSSGEHSQALEMFLAALEVKLLLPLLPFSLRSPALRLHASTPRHGGRGKPLPQPTLPTLDPPPLLLPPPVWTR